MPNRLLTTLFGRSAAAADTDDVDEAARRLAGLTSGDISAEDAAAAAAAAAAENAEDEEEDEAAGDEEEDEAAAAADDDDEDEAAAADDDDEEEDEAADDDEEEEEDQANAVRMAERARVAGILDSDEAKGRGKLAQHLAFKTAMSVDDAKVALMAAPKGGRGLAERMAEVDNPALGPGGGSGGASDTVEAAADRLASFARPSAR